MNKNVFNVILFATGAVIGSLVTWKVVKTKYEEIAQEEIDSVKSEYTQLMMSMKKKLNDSVIRNDDNNDPDDNSDDSFDETEMTNYHRIVDSYRHSDNAEDDSDNDETQNEREGDEKEEDDEVPYINGPYVISDDEFGDRIDFSAQPLDYFADGVLADGWGVKLDIDETIGEDALNHFGDYTDDIVYVRNEINEIDYEVTKDPRTYAEAVGTNPNSYYG